MSGEDFEVEVDGDGLILRGTRDGSGRLLLLAHGLTAHRDLVVHGSRVLERAGYRLIRYDARGHGSSDAGRVGSYDYDRLADDLEAVLDAELPPEGSRPVLIGHSMGAHTILTAALRDSTRFGGLVLISPASVGVPLDRDSLIRWDALADGLREGGIDGFISAYDDGLDPTWRETLIRIARSRLSRHRDLDAVAEAIREVPRSVPFDGLGELAGIAIPTLVIASHDKADPGHPLSVAEAYVEAMPRARMLSEGEGESPLAWQGGRLSREIAAFCAELPSDA